MSDLRLLSCARLLEQGQRLDQFSTGLSLVALGGALLAVTLAKVPLVAVLLLLCLLAGALEKYWALRVAFDAALFARVAEAADLPAATQQLDDSLHGLGLLPAHNKGRDWTLRCQGAMALLRNQGLSLAAQVLLAVAAVLAGAFL
jgi:hypothetical protein